ncbi:MAG: hypothetical protein LBQ89_08120 [Treponema sp.]|jgi:hypothetical protein|nr:hypothetical protein [Treponema sp.]
MKKIKMSYRAADILDGVFTVVYLVLAYWVDWRIGLAFLAYDLSCVFSHIKDDIAAEKRVEELLEVIRKGVKEIRRDENVERRTSD